MRRLDLIVGPNGAGKTTFVAEVLARYVPGVPFVNADEIARGRWPEDPAGHAYEAARVAEETRAALLRLGRSFIAETVFSHPSKVQLVADAARAGHLVHLHVLLVPEELAVARVAFRVRAGGHAVPEQKVRERYGRLWANVARAVPLAHTAIFYDTSRHDRSRIVAQLIAGVPTGAARGPEWTPRPLRALAGA